MEKSLIYCICCSSMQTCDNGKKHCFTCEETLTLDCEGVRSFDWTKEIEYCICKICFLDLRWEVFAKREN